MLLIPVIEFRRGRAASAAPDPVAVADGWIAAGAERLYLVDHDGISAGRAAGADVVRRIARAHPHMPLLVAGGVRSEETADEYLQAGAEYLVLGKRAMAAPHLVNDLCLEFPGHVMVALEVRDGRVAADGWSKVANDMAVEVAENLERQGVAGIVYDDRGDGAASTAALDAHLLALMRAVRVPVIASRAAASLGEVRALARVAEEGLQGALLAATLEASAFAFAEAQALARGFAGGSAASGVQ
ncbi:MAG TPA: HisA/HisF-related TIM barrel protein [Gammaproteobacteria bacterium]|nr:HisA/HisF-related TIM barrel protein [Gammaproteobacteria bacterium]